MSPSPSAWPPFTWPLVDAFVGRADELAQLDAWWDGPGNEPLALIGRRRVGKSWLFRRFAHGRPAVVLVADQLPAHSQLSRFADTLAPLLGVRPAIPDVSSLLQVLYRLAHDTKVLVVIDEFPALLGTTAAEARRALSAMQAVMEDERERSQLKLILCGSHVSQMEGLFSETNPMHGRLRKLQVRPLGFADAQQFMPSMPPLDAFERFAITGGMPMYLARLASGPMRRAVCEVVLDRDAPLFNEGRSLVDQELREPRVYFAILEQLAAGAKPANEIAQAISTESNVAHKYLVTLEQLRLVAKRIPIGAAATSRSGRWHLEDAFLRFWFRFVFPFQSDLESGLQPAALFDAEISGGLADHVAPVFEDWCRSWLRSASIGGATRVGSWWGNALDELRRTKERSTEEIDAVGLSRNRAVVVAEAKWTSAPLGPRIVDDVERYKIPALRQVMRVAERPAIVLFSKSGYSDALRARAASEAHIVLVDVAAALAEQRDRAAGA